MPCDLTGFSDLVQVLKTAMSRGPVAYVPNPGNAGDSLIGLGTLDFFGRIGLSYRIASKPDALKSGTVIFAGGGALIGAYRRSEAIFRQCLTSGCHVIVLPHTITKLPKGIEPYTDKLTLFARERRTFEYLKSGRGVKQLFLAEDMAFALRDRHALRPHAPLSALITSALWDASPRGKAKLIKRLPGALKAFWSLKRSGSTRLNCFRTDVESRTRNVPNANIDISDSYQLGTESPGSIKLSSALLVRTLARFSEVHTDRLHCCIAGALLGKQVILHENNYHKNRSIFEFSLQHRYPNVQLAPLN